MSALLGVDAGLVHALPRRATALGRRGAKRGLGLVLPRAWFAYRGSRRSRRVSVTFDDGPNALTPAYLQVLEHYGVRATFFVVGRACREQPDLIATIARAGHELGGHGFTHRAFTELAPSELQAELARTAALLPSHGPRRLIRPPYGYVSAAALLTCAHAGYTTVLWSRDSEDWRTHDAGQLVAGFRHAPAAAGDVLLFHEGQPWTLAALPPILEQLLRSGHELVPVGEMFRR